VTPPPETNGSYVSRNELSAHIRRLDDNIDAIRHDVSEIKTSLGAGPRWAGARFNALIDKVLPTLLAAAAIWVLSGRV
jgi:hypothetical protein